MKGSKILSAVFGVLGILLMVATAAVSIASRNAQPRMLESPEAASAQAQRMMDALCIGDYATAQSCIYGQPDLGAGEPEDAVSKLLWDAFTDSLSYRAVPGHGHGICPGRDGHLSGCVRRDGGSSPAGEGAAAGKGRGGRGQNGNLQRG